MYDAHRIWVSWMMRGKKGEESSPQPWSTKQLEATKKRRLIDFAPALNHKVLYGVMI